MEIWIIYAILTALFTTAAALTGKKTLLKEHAMEFATVLAILTVVVSIPLLLVIDYSKLELKPILILFFVSILGATAFLLATKSIRHMKISDSTPLLALAPGLTSLLAFIFLKETLSKYQIMGILLLIAGVYVLETKKTLNLLDPIKKLKESKYTGYIFLAIIIYSITAMFDRILLSRYDMQPAAYIVIAQIFIAFHFIILLTLFHNGFKGVKHGLKNAGWWIFLVAIFTVGYRLSQAEAIKIANVGLVVSIKRISSLFTILIGGEMFHEKGLLRKTMATIIIIAGAILILL